jgi:anti-sigma factor RsiW
VTCEHTRLYLHAYVDDELGAADAVHFEQHLSHCAECQQAHRQSLALRSALRRADLYYQSAPMLSARVQAAVRNSARPRRGSERMRSFLSGWQWIAAAACVPVLIAVAVFWTARRAQPVRQDVLARAVVDSHIRSLQANHLVDVPSSDRHTVKPWFQGKLDFSPPVPDLSARGWVLEGGRLDYVEGKPVAAIVYERRKHQINVFVWRAEDRREQPIQKQSVQGYQILFWSKSGMTYWITSDLNPAELTELAQLLWQGG